MIISFKSPFLMLYHGNSHSCIECHSAYPNDAMRAAVTAREVPHCPSCNGLVKPDIVFFGEALPPHFFANRELPALADLCIIIGTSLSVHPFASLPQFVREGVPRYVRSVFVLLSVLRTPGGEMEEWVGCEK